MTTFPTCGDGDVKIILKHDSAADTMILHSAKLAEASTYFNASLKKPEWSSTQSELSSMFKPRIMMLDFEDEDTFPLLVSKEAKDLSKADEWHEKLEAYDEPIENGSRDALRLAQKRHHSEFVIGAYKLGFALLYNVKVDLPSSTVSLSQLVPALVAFADAYDLLEPLRYRILATLLSGPLDVNDVIAANPFAMTYASHHLRSAAMYKEAMRHTIALHDLSQHGDEKPIPNTCQYFCALRLNRISIELALRHKTYRDDMEMLYQMLLQGPERRGVFYANSITNNVAIGIFRDWLIANFKNRQAGIIKLSKKDYNLGSVMVDFGGQEWMDAMGNIPSYHNTSIALQECFSQALEEVHEMFPPENLAKGLPSESIKEMFPAIEEGYLPSVSFEAVEGQALLVVRNYPWDNAAKEDKRFDMQTLGESLEEYL